MYTFLSILILLLHCSNVLGSCLDLLHVGFLPTCPAPDGSSPYEMLALDCEMVNPACQLMTDHNDFLLFFL